MLYDLASAPLSPINSQGEGQDWINELLARSAPMTTTNSMAALTNLNPIPSNFEMVNIQQDDLSQFFEADEIFSGNEFITSSETSEGNSPHINVKVEEPDTILTDLRTVNSKLQDLKQLNNFTPKSLESIFETKDILKGDLRSSIKDSSTSLALLVDGFSTSSSSTNLAATNKPINKCASRRKNPRKRLTDSQKQAHNKIEKRYRININAKIAGLQHIIPSVADEKTAFETGAGLDNNPNENPSNKLNKSMILEKATDYILYLQKRDQQLTQENAELRKEIVRLGGGM